jgi:hypothetical protein
VHADLMALVGHGLHVLGERLDRVAGDEPRRRDVVLVEQLEQAARADLAREQAGESPPAYEPI